MKRLLEFDKATLFTENLELDFLGSITLRVYAGSQING